MTTAGPRPLLRPISTLLVAVLTATVLVATPGTARAHDSCAIAQPAATGVLGSVLSAVNVFSSFLEASTAPCSDKFEDVVSVMHRDWGVQDEDPADAFDPSDARPSSNNAPRTAAPCVDGMAADFFPCDGVDLLSHVSHAELGTVRGNDIWGWTDPRTRKDYALFGSTTGTVFVDISDARRPRVLGIMPTASTTGGASWRDIKVYRDHAFVVSEHDNHGVQVFDLTRLRSWDGSYTTYEEDVRYMEHGSAHNININEDTGFAYSVGAGPTEDQLPLRLVVAPPSSAAGDYPANRATFGGDPVGLTGDIVAATDGVSAAGGGTPTDGCEPLVDFPQGAIALVDRGLCPFTDKAQNAQAAGASGVIIANNRPGNPPRLPGSAPTVTIPALSVSQATGQTVRAGQPASGTVVENENQATCGTGLHMIDVRNPKNPVFAGCDDSTGYVHDTQCVVYEGPDAEFRGREICFNSNGLAYSAAPGTNFVSIVDVTDKSAPVTLSRLPYEGSGYSHQGWLTEDQAYFLHGDEGDEQIRGVTTTTRVWNVTDLRNPEVVETFTNGGGSIDHNLYTEGDYAYASNYTTGLRVYDVSGAGDEGLAEVGFFDIYPENDNATFEGGTWSNYPYFRQRGVVAVSSIDRGLFILQPRVARSS